MVQRGEIIWPQQLGKFTQCHDNFANVTLFVTRCNIITKLQNLHEDGLHQAINCVTDVTGKKWLQKCKKKKFFF